MFVVDQAVDVVASRVRPSAGLPVDGQSSGEIVRDSDVEVAGPAGKDVDPEIVFAFHREQDNSDCATV